MESLETWLVETSDMGKLHVCIDCNTQEILAVELTGNEEDDASVGSKMLAGKTKHIVCFHGDGFGFRSVLGDRIGKLSHLPAMWSYKMVKGKTFAGLFGSV
jgi:hypothetical protein